MKDHGATGDDYGSKDNRDLLRQFLTEMESTSPAITKEQKPERSVTEDLGTHKEQAEPTDQSEFIQQTKEDGRKTKRAIPNAINYAAQEFSGEVNEQYLINSNPDKVKTGTKIIIEAYDGTPVPMYDRDANGRVKTENGKRVTAVYNATSAAAAGKEIPIAIYLVDNNGNKKELIGWLPELAWLNERDPKTGEHINILDGDNPAVTAARIDEIGALRDNISNAFAIGANSSVRSTIESVSVGVPVQSDTMSNISEVMPDLIADVKKLGLSSPFAYFDNGAVISPDASLDVAYANQL